MQSHDLYDVEECYGWTWNNLHKIYL